MASDEINEQLKKYNESKKKLEEDRVRKLQAINKLIAKKKAEANKGQIAATNGVSEVVDKELLKKIDKSSNIIEEDVGELDKKASDLEYKIFNTKYDLKKRIKIRKWAFFGLLLGTTAIMVGGGFSSSYFVTQAFLNCDLLFYDEVTEQEVSSISGIGNKIKIVTKQNQNTLANIQYAISDDKDGKNLTSQYAEVVGSTITSKKIPTSITTLYVFAFQKNKKIAVGMLNILPFQNYQIHSYMKKGLLETEQNFLQYSQNQEERTLILRCFLNGKDLTHSVPIEYRIDDPKIIAKGVVYLSGNQLTLTGPVDESQSIPIHLYINNTYIPIADYVINIFSKSNFQVVLMPGDNAFLSANNRSFRIQTFQSDNKIGASPEDKVPKFNVTEYSTYVYGPESLPYIQSNVRMEKKHDSIDGWYLEVSLIPHNTPIGAVNVDFTIHSNVPSLNDSATSFSATVLRDEYEIKFRDGNEEKDTLSSEEGKKLTIEVHKKDGSTLPNGGFFSILAEANPYIKKESNNILHENVIKWADKVARPQFVSLLKIKIYLGEPTLDLQPAKYLGTYSIKLMPAQQYTTNVYDNADSIINYTSVASAVGGTSGIYKIKTITNSQQESIKYCDSTGSVAEGTYFYYKIANDKNNLYTRLAFESNQWVLTILKIPTNPLSIRIEVHKYIKGAGNPTDTVIDEINFVLFSGLSRNVMLSDGSNWRNHNNHSDAKITIVPNDTNGDTATIVDAKNYLLGEIEPERNDRILEIPSIVYNPASNKYLVITEIGSQAFASQAAIANGSPWCLKLPDTIKSIGSQAFAGSKLTKILTGSQLKNIGEEAFKNCRDFELFEYNAPWVPRVGRNAFLNTADTGYVTNNRFWDKNADTNEVRPWLESGNGESTNNWRYVSHDHAVGWYPRYDHPLYGWEHSQEIYGNFIDWKYHKVNSLTKTYREDKNIMGGTNTGLHEWDGTKGWDIFPSVGQMHHYKNHWTKSKLPGDFNTDIKEKWDYGYNEFTKEKTHSDDASIVFHLDGNRIGGRSYSKWSKARRGDKDDKAISFIGGDDFDNKYDLKNVTDDKSYQDFEHIMEDEHTYSMNLSTWPGITGLTQRSSATDTIVAKPYLLDFSVCKDLQNVDLAYRHYIGSPSNSAYVVNNVGDSEITWPRLNTVFINKKIGTTEVRDDSPYAGDGDSILSCWRGVPAGQQIDIFSQSSDGDGLFLSDGAKYDSNTYLLNKNVSFRFHLPRASKSTVNATLGAGYEIYYDYAFNYIDEDSPFSKPFPQRFKLWGSEYPFTNNGIKW